MSGWMLRVVAAVVAVALGCGATMAGLAPEGPGSAPAAVTVSLADASFDSPLPGALTPDAALDAALPAPVATQATPAPVPLPPGVVVGLVGLASAAIARRRYLKRH